MHSNCPECGSENIMKRGTRKLKDVNYIRQDYSCTSCSNWFSNKLHVDDYRKKDQPAYINLRKEELELTYEYSNKKRFVITSCQNDTKINRNFYETLKNYAEVNNAELIILRTKYKVSEADKEHYFVDSDHLLTHNIVIADKIKVFGALNLMPTLVSPLSGLEMLSKGYTCVFGHNSVQMKTLPVNDGDHPIMMATTGTLSVPNNSDTKTGQKADYTHCFSASIIELEDDKFHMRMVTADDKGGFYDLDKYYLNKNIEENQIVEALILGDVHVDVADNEVVYATFYNPDSIVNVLKPKTLVLHDLYDNNQLSSHHLTKNYIGRFSKYVAGEDDVEAELNKTVKFIEEIDNPYVQKNVVVASNHLDHLEKWLNNSDIKTDYKNSILYHKLMYKLLTSIVEGREVSAFQLYFEDTCTDEDVLNKTIFLGREDSYFIKDILISSHGDMGLGGSRFSPTQGKKFPHKMVVGHSHQPVIEQNLYVTGTMTGKLSYAKGVPSGWMNSHVVIYPDGSRTHINIVKGTWKL